MALILRPGQGFLYMKVGTHAKESLEEIIARKTQEIERAGFAVWSYGGSTCHPESMVQPFARSYQQRGGVIYLCMQEMNSKHFAEPLRAKEFSIDGVKWEQIHPDINVRGSRYALAINKLRVEEFELPLKATKVAIGNSMGRAGNLYIAGRVDKACLEVTEEMNLAAQSEEKVRIGLVAELIEPFAVYVR